MNHVSNTRRLAGVFFATLFLFACATPPQTRGLLAEPSASLPVAVELKDTPFHPQDRFQCGPAALATVLGAHSIDVTPEELVDAVFIPALHGSLPEEITATARQYGMLAYQLQPSLSDLLREVAQGNPVLVFQNLGTSWFPKWHFAVVVGYDLASREIILRSGTTRRWHTTLAVLERTWSRSGYWALVILPAGSIPASAQPDRYLQAAHDLEASNQTGAAMLAYQAAVQRWPDEPHAWMAYANRLYALSDYRQAETAFRKATRLAPADARGWNNLAYALLGTDCPRQARQAAACAASLAPTVANYRNTITEINALADGNDGQHCRPVDCKSAINKLKINELGK
jgi:tetratricopeptide (TPR) repeat protein